MTSALIGASGFVGTSLQHQRQFDAHYRSTNIADIAGQRFETIVCAGAPAQKWIANRDPQADHANLQRLMTPLKSVNCQTFILISTVDVFRQPLGVDESSPIDETDLHAYGLHRRQLECFVQEHFPRTLIVRLPGLVGPGLRKNALYDLAHDNNLHAIDSRGIFQFYPLVNLWHDIQIALDAGLSLVHLSAAPLSIAEIAQQAFGCRFEQTLDSPPARYDFRSGHAQQFGGSGPYQYSARESLLAIRAYAQGVAHQQAEPSQ